jgi:transcription initiation factor TFIID subunit 10
MAGLPGMGPGQMPGVPGAPGGKEGGPGEKGDKGKNAHLGVQRPGFGGGGQSSSQGRTVLTMEDLGMAVGEYGVNVRRGEFYR